MKRNKSAEKRATRAMEELVELADQDLAAEAVARWRAFDVTTRTPREKIIYFDYGATIWEIADDESEAIRCVEAAGAEWRNLVRENEVEEDIVSFIENRIAFSRQGGVDCRLAAAALDEAVGYTILLDRDDVANRHLRRDVLTERARHLAHVMRLEEAGAAARAAIDEHDDCGDEQCAYELGYACTVAAEIQFALEEPRSAAALWDRVFELWAGGAHAETCGSMQEVRFNAARAYEANGEPEKAIAQLERLVERIDAGQSRLSIVKESEVFETLGRMFEEIDECEKAADAAGRCASVRERMAAEDESWKGGVVAALANRALSLSHIERFEDAHAALDRAMTFAGDDPASIVRIQARRRDAWHDAEDHDRAIAASAELIAWLQKHGHAESAPMVDALTIHSQLHRCIDDYANALSFADAAIALIESGTTGDTEPAATAWAYRAEALIGLDRVEESLEPFRRALALFEAADAAGDDNAMRNAIALAHRLAEVADYLGDTEALAAAKADVARLTGTTAPKLVAV